MPQKDTITVLRGPERIRKRPLVVFGADGTDGTLNAVIRLLTVFVNEAAKNNIAKYFKWVFDDQLKFCGDIEFRHLSHRVALFIATQCDSRVTVWENATGQAITNKMITDMAADAFGEEFRCFLKANRREIAAILGLCCD